MKKGHFVDAVGYITVLFGTIGFLGEISLYHRLLNLANALKAEAAAGSSLGINLMLAFVTMIPPLTILVGLSLLAKGGDSDEDGESGDTHWSKDRGGGL